MTDPVLRQLTCNHDLPLPARTSLKDALHAYADRRKPLSLEWSRFATTQGGAAGWLQPHLRRDRELRELIKQQAADAAAEARVSINVPAFMRELAEAFPAMEFRRAVAHTVAKRLKGVSMMGTKRQARDLCELPESMFLCRVDGHAGATEDGGARTAWAHKCGSTRFCPDCAREHAKWEAERYGAAIMEHVNKGPAYRAYQAVMTLPTVRQGDMAKGVKHRFEAFRAFLDAKRPCRGIDQELYGYSPRKKLVPVWQPAPKVKGQPYDGPGIHGALVQLECHLTAKGEWHPHLNVLFLTKGDFTFDTVREVWGGNVHIQQVTGTPEGIARSFGELIKYAFRHVAEKNLDKREAGDTEAPPFEEWPDAAVVEWHAATRGEVETADGGTRIQGSRWLRSYGVLHGIPPPEIAETEVRWIVAVSFTDDGRYVGSIPGSKFQNSTPKGHLPGYELPDFRQPPRRPNPLGDP